MQLSEPLDDAANLARSRIECGKLRFQRGVALRETTDRCAEIPLAHVELAAIRMQPRTLSIPIAGQCLTSGIARVEPRPGVDEAPDV